MYKNNYLKFLILTLPLQQLGVVCYCGNTFGRYGTATWSRCNRKCYGTSSGWCGGSSGSDEINVYDLTRVELPCTTGTVELQQFQKYCLQSTILNVFQSKATRQLYDRNQITYNLILE